ncbi:MAG: hypothetical protein LKM37_05505 [Bacteroidales bacterium]|jgi:hypothetical protein|nr:hypothetical protein [Bacteroidales bacterium]MCI1733961.1 hypothetical protein [Bacteroidales bacterium]
MKKRSNIFCLAFLAAAFFASMFFSSCNKTPDYDGQLSSFMANNTIGLYSLDRTAFRYDSTNCQIVRNDSRRMIRLQKDDQSELVNAVFSVAAFGFEKEIDIKVSYASSSYSKEFTLKTYLVQMQDGLYWFWDGDKKTGLIIPADD